MKTLQQRERGGRQLVRVPLRLPQGDWHVPDGLSPDDPGKGNGERRPVRRFLRMERRFRLREKGSGDAFDIRSDTRRRSARENPLREHSGSGIMTAACRRAQNRYRQAGRTDDVPVCEKGDAPHESRRAVAGKAQIHPEERTDASTPGSVRTERTDPHGKEA